MLSSWKPFDIFKYNSVQADPALYLLLYYNKQHFFDFDATKPGIHYGMYLPEQQNIPLLFCSCAWCGILRKVLELKHKMAWRQQQKARRK